jgi:nucleotide-binding universal stress UspA family protein
MITTNDVLERRSTRPLMLDRTCRILVPADFSASSDAAFEYASLLAWRSGATIDIVHVLDVHAAMGRERRRVLAVEWSSKVAELDDLASAHRKAGVEVRCRLEFGGVLATLARVATRDRFDLIVMGSHGDTASSRSTAAVVRSSVRCPVIHVRALPRPGRCALQPLDTTSPRRAARHDVHELA